MSVHFDIFSKELEEWNDELHRKNMERARRCLQRLIDWYSK